MTNKGVSDTSPLAGKTFVLVGAGGAGRALAFGAKSRGAQVIIFNRNYGKQSYNIFVFGNNMMHVSCASNYT